MEAATALLTVELAKLGFDPQHGVDRYFSNKAKRDKKRSVALETVDFQVSLFTSLTKKEQEDLLRESLADVKRWKFVLDDMVNAWKTGDAKTLDELITKEMRGYPDLHKKLLLDRNQRWVTQIEPYLAGKEDVFVVVGAGHLVGGGSVVDLLQKKGFRLQQL